MLIHYAHDLHKQNFRFPHAVDRHRWRRMTSAADQKFFRLSNRSKGGEWPATARRRASPAICGSSWILECQMRVDAKHAAKCRSSITVDESGAVFAKIDVERMHNALSGLSPWERGILMTAVMKSVTAKRPTLSQRALMALFISGHRDGSNE